MTQAEIIQDIRKHCKMAMDGAKSASMRNLGLDYKLNFGLLLTQIEQIAGKYESNAELAQALWDEKARELIIAATHLYPLDEFTLEIANRWAREITNQEIREQVCINLFQELPYADQIAVEWANHSDEKLRVTGYWLLARLLLAKKYNGILSSKSFEKIWNDITLKDVFLRNSSMLVLKHIGRQGKEESDKILARLLKHENSEDPFEREAYNSLAFEFEFIWG